MQLIFFFTVWFLFRKMFSLANVCSLFSDHACRNTDAGAAARPVPPVQPADGSGPGAAAQRPPEAAAGPVTGHSAHHLANSPLPGNGKCQQPLPGQPEPEHCQYQCQLGKRAQSGCRDLSCVDETMRTLVSSYRDSFM